MSILYSDCKERLVYHWQIIGAFLLSLIGSYIYGYPLNFMAFIISLSLGFLLWKLNFIGGGDIKLISSIIICFSCGEIWLLMLVISSIGLFIAILTLALKSKRGVPYAPAIILGHLIVFYDTYLKGFYE